jgi:hypothetical protein
MLHKEIDRDKYFYYCYMLFDHRNNKRLNIEDPDMSVFATFRSAKDLAEKYCLDLSDALQIVALKEGLFSHFVQESKPVLITIDGDFATAASNEGLRVWNCKEAEIPPDPTFLIGRGTRFSEKLLICTRSKVSLGKGYQPISDKCILPWTT